MLGHKVREFKPLPGICWEDWVPEDNFYRQWNEAVISVLSVSWLPNSIPTSGVHRLIQWFSSNSS